MTQEQMNEALKDVIAIERDFYRNLTDEEVRVVIEEGFEALFARLGLSENDYKVMRRIFALISAGFTENDARYDDELAKENYNAIEILEALIADLKAVASEKKDTVTKVNLDLKEDMEDHGYDENQDTDMNKYFTEEAQHEADDSIDFYNPDKDEELKESFDNERDNILDQLVFDYLSVLYPDLAKTDEIQVSKENVSEVLNWLEENNMNYTITVVDDTVTIKVL